MPHDAAPLAGACPRDARVLAVMQPYFLPYLGYWQLVHAVDTFILLDDVQYIRHGWVNRNRILKHGGGWQYIAVPLRKHPISARIREIEASTDRDWRGQILRQLEHYRYHGRAPHYDEVMAFLSRAFAKLDDPRISRINCSLTRAICAHLGLGARILLSSELGLSYADVEGPGDWALSIARQTNARKYINPAGGAALFDADKYASSGVELAFLHCGDISYDQRPGYEEALSIVDVLMFNGTEGSRKLLERYSVVSALPDAAPPAAHA